ncbi:hypothetical protein HY621_01435 [Candidatus Uhrbacteria bacterium]|nr:hypothetical protein [Candidatus Uhrbacteria bacterium]
MYYKTYLLTLSVLLLMLFSYLHSTPVFPDPDSFYHARITALMVEKKNIITDFQWLPFTTLKKNFIDHHLIYHLFLSPFVAVLGPLWGIKIASSLAATAVWIVFWLLAWHLVPIKNSHKKAALISLFTVSLLFNETFFLRMNLEKIPAVSVLWLFGGVYSILYKKTKLVFFLSFFYVWLHSGWPLLPLIALLTRDRAIILASFLGALAGLIINPYFPQNISFYLIQIYDIAIINYRHILPVGSEWYPPGSKMIIWNLPAIFFYCISTILLFARPIFPPSCGNTKRSPREWFLFCVSTLFFLLTIKSARHGEYFVPFATLFGALVIIPHLYSITAEEMQKKIMAFLWRGFYSTFGVLTFASLLMIVLLNSLWNVIRTFTQGSTIYKYEGAAAFLQKLTKKNEIVFHDRWDSMYPLWYYNQDNRYISGFDPTFLYKKNPELFWMYERISQGAIQKNIGERIYSLFGARAIMVEKENKPLQAALKKDESVKKMYEDKFLEIYQSY